LKILMIGKAKDNFEQWEEELKDDNEDNWKKLLGKVQDYATRRRLDANYAKTNGDPLDITEVNDNWGNQDEWGYEEWGNQWDSGGYGSFDAIGKGFKGKGFKGKGKGGYKGKGKGKSMGFDGQCYTCGEHGHSARFCPHGNGKAKGKGKDQTICYNCGKTGHVAAYCPKGKGKGAAMAWLNQGQGKGQSWNIRSVQQPVQQMGNTQDVNLAEFTPPAWDTGNQTIEADFGGQWGSTINEISADSEWAIVARRARGNRDMRPMRTINCSHGNHLHSIERAGNPMKCINEVTSGNGNWEKITVTIDSGAVDSVGPRTMASDIGIKDTPASRAGLKYRAANGTPIDNLGEKSIQGVTKQGNKVGMTFQIADVRRPLGAVRAMLAAGNKVVFETGNSYIQDKTRTIKTPIEERNGAYVLHLEAEGAGQSCQYG